MAFLLFAAILLGSAASASAYVKGGTPWPHGVIRYYNSYKADSTEVATAVSAWNHSGAHVHFVSTSRAKASVIVYSFPKHFASNIGGECFSGANGCASIGFVGTRGHFRQSTLGINGKQQNKGYVYLKAPDASHLRPAGLMDVVATHEFGHVLGLAHSRQCATMDEILGYSCRISGDNQADRYICNPLQTDDSRGAVALYGGQPHRYALRTCLFVDPPIAPINLTANLIYPDPGGSYGEIQIHFTAPPGETLYYPGQTVNTVSAYVFAVNLGSCIMPTNASYGGEETPNGSETDTLYPYPSQPGTYCVTVENQDDFSQFSKPAEVLVTVPPAPSQ